MATLTSENGSTRRLQGLLRHLSAHFIGLPVSEIGPGIEHALRQIVEFLDVDRCTLFEFSADGTELSALSSWARSGLQPFRPGAFQRQLPWYHAELLRGRRVVLAHMPDDLPAEALAERDYAVRSGMRSNLSIPIFVGDRPTCVLALGNFRHHRTWPAETIELLELTGELLAAGLNRKRDAAETSAAQALARDFFDSLDSMAAVIDRDGIILEVNESWRSAVDRGDLEKTTGVGIDYLGVCERALASGDEDAARSLNGIRSVLSGDSRRFLHEYSCPTPGGTRWFLLRVLPLNRPSGGAVIMHIDISERIASSRRLERSLAEVKRLTAILEEQNLYLKEEIQSDHDFENIVGNSASLRAVLARIERVASTNATVLLLGETGTGKELLAHAIHERSSRCAQPLIKVNCAALPPSLIESELFGHERGAFTGAMTTKKGRFELADAGTLFLDEVGDLGIELQAKLLRVLESGEFERVGSSRTRQVDARVVAATHRDLSEAVAQGSFRADLFHRLGGFPVHVPPLRDRAEDIPLLVWHFLVRCEREWGRRIDNVSPAVMAALCDYGWPGNVRELKNVVERAFILSPGDSLQLDPGSLGPAVTSPISEVDQTLDMAQRKHILQILEQCDWRINGPGNAAARLAIHPNTLRHRMRKLRIERPDH